MNPKNISKCITLIADSKIILTIFWIIYFALTFLPVAAMAFNKFENMVMIPYVIAVVMVACNESSIRHRYPVFGGLESQDMRTDALISGGKKLCTALSVFPVTRKNVMTAFWNEWGVVAVSSAVSVFLCGVWFAASDIPINVPVCIFAPLAVMIYFTLMSFINGEKASPYKNIFAFIQIPAIILVSIIGDVVFTAESFEAASRTGGFILIAASLIAAAAYLFCRRRSIRASEGVTLSCEKITR